MQGGQIDRLFMIYKNNSLKERRTDMAAISIDGTPMTALPSDADQINYDNTSSGLSATEVQDAIDELALEKKDEYETITYAQWQALTPAQQAAKDYYISDYPSSAITAGNVSYNNSSSGMVANNVQSAVDELKSGLTSVETRISELQVYKKWDRSITVPGGMNTIVMYAKMSGQSNMFTYNSYTDVLTPIGNSSDVTATKDASTDTVTFTATTGGSFAVYVL